MIQLQNPFKTNQVGNLIVGTHNGEFHADDVLAFAILVEIRRTHGGAINLLRSRDPVVLAKADIVMDVGGKYDPELQEFDHHQVEGAGARVNGIPYAAAGLIWKHYGAHVIAGIYEKKGLTEAQIVAIHDRVDKYVISPTDASDCGYDLAENWKGDVRPFTFAKVVAGYNPGYQDPSGDEVMIRQFRLASILAQNTLVQQIKWVGDAVLGADEVRAALKARTVPEILVLDSFAPWGDVVFDDNVEELRYIVFPALEGDYRVQVVPVGRGSFELRKPLPKTWAGLRNSEMDQVTGIDGCVFCHRACFIGGHKTKEGAVKLAEMALAAK
jgi:uncharacterized UPF0160 family protein